MHSNIRKNSKSGTTTNTTHKEENPDNKNGYKIAFQAAFISTLGVFLYSIIYITGLSYHQRYLSEYGVPFGLFPQQPTDYLIYAYMSIINALSKLLNPLTSYKAWLVLAGTIAALIIYAALLTRLAKSEFLEKKLNGLESKKKTLWAIIITLLSFSSAGVIVLAPAVLILLLALPTQLGSYGAKISVEYEKAEFEKGCKPTNQSTEYCHSIKDNSGTIISGHIISTSTTHIAIYSNNSSYIYPISGKTIELNTSPQE
ncbi:hypothetical protein [Pseudomonas nitroreducens]|uniref:hypothetical protein n=1 Tax=Pseudomonas nitroreducens TaxID=46680 RepID=UPI00382B77EE